MKTGSRSTIAIWRAGSSARKDIHGVLRAAYSRVTDPMSSGRNMPSHYSSRKYHVMPTFSEVGRACAIRGRCRLGVQAGR